MNRSRKHIAFVLALLLSLCTLAGCGGNADGGTGSTGDTGSTGETEGAAESVSPEETSSREQAGRTDAAYTVYGGEDGGGTADGTQEEEDTASEETEDAYSRALAGKSQVYDPTKSSLISEDDGERTAQKRDYTVMVYMIGSNLESVGGNATKDMEEMEAAGLDYSKTNLILYTGGSMRWMGNVPSEQNSIIDLSMPQESRIRAHTDGNADMGAPDTLAAFINYCTAVYPADHYALIFWDHGGGPIMGYGLDELFDDDSLLLTEMKSAMAATDFGESQKLDFVGFDACLMGSLESMSVWRNYANYYVASSETEPGAGWDYSFLRVLNETTDAGRITERIIDCYAASYEQKRSDSFDPDTTLSCTDLSEIDSVLDALDALSTKLSASLDKGDYSQIQQLRTQVKSFGNLGTSSGKGSVRYDLVDAEDFAEKFAGTYPKECAALQEAVSSAVVKNYSNVEDSCGLTLYYPYGNKDMYRGAGTLVRSILPSEDYYSFLSALTGTWLAGHERDWALSAVQQEGEEYTLQLTQDQLENMAGAYYTVFWKDTDGKYLPVMENISVRPDENGVLHVPADPTLICMTMNEDEDGSLWGFGQISSDRKRIVYASHTTGLLKMLDIFRDSDDPQFVDIYLSQDIETGEFRILNVSSVSEDGTAVSKDTVDVTGYSLFYHAEHSRYAQKNADGTTRAYKDWSGSTMDWLFYEVITGTPRFYTSSASAVGGEYAIQVVLEDTSGDEYGSEIVELENNDAGTLATSSTPGGTLTYSVYRDHAAVTGYGGTDTELEIPSSIEGKPVTTIEDRALDSQYTIKKLRLPTSVTTIESNACSYMSALEEVSLPEGLETIGMSAFESCSSLQEVTLPDGLTELGASAFYECRSLQSVSIPQTCTELGMGIFCDCPRLSEIELRGSNPAYKEQDGAILTADGKTLVAFPQASANEIVIPDGVETIGYGAFFGARDLKEVTFPDTLETIEYMAFYDCTGLQNIEFPESLVTIKDQAFGLSWLYYQEEGYEIRAQKREPIPIHIGANILEIGEGAFDVFLAREFTVDEENPYYSEREGALMNKAGDQVEAPATDGTGIIVVPDGTVSFGWDLLDLCESYTASAETDMVQNKLENYEVVLPSSVIRFESAEAYSNTDKVLFHCPRGSAAWAFAENNDIRHDDVISLGYREVSQDTQKGVLTYHLFEDHAQLIGYSGEDVSLIIPETVEGLPVTVLGDGSDEGLAKDSEDFLDKNDTLEEVTLPSSVTEIEDYTFDRFDELSDMNLPDSLTILGDEALPSGYRLERLPAHIEYLGENFAWSDLEGELSIPSSVRRIDPRAFAHMRRITGFVLEGDSEVYSAREGVLYSADGTELVCYPPAGPEEAVIADGVTRIGDYAFSDVSIRSVTFSSSVTEVGDYAFVDKFKLESVDFNDGLQSIGNSAFSGCGMLTEISIPESVTEIGAFAFAFCDLQSLTVPGSVESIGDCAFERNENLTQLHLEEGARTIGYGAFKDDTNLSSIELPDSLYSIGNAAFSTYWSYTDAEALEDFLSQETFTLHIGANLTQIGQDAFGGLALSGFSVDEQNNSFGTADGFLTDISGEVLLICPAGRTGTIEVPEKITRIESQAFYSCKGITDVYIPDSVTAFGSSVFSRETEYDAQTGTSTYVATLTIHCGKGSAAEKYAIENDIPYVTE